jgi:hypothetical protein
MEKTIDPKWTIHNDKQSVTVGINTRFWILRQQNMVPTLIRLGKEHTRLFLREHGLAFIPNRPYPFLTPYLFWDPERRCICYTKRMIPIRFNDPLIHGIFVEGEPKPKKKST